MQLRAGDRFIDETGEWEIGGRPYGMVGGKLVHARVRKVGEPAVIELQVRNALRERGRVSGRPERARPNRR